jgi:hypothetical protein
VGQRPDENASHQRLPRHGRQRKKRCLEKEFHDFTDKMRYLVSVGKRLFSAGKP